MSGGQLASVGGDGAIVTWDASDLRPYVNQLFISSRSLRYHCAGFFCSNCVRDVRSKLIFMPLFR